MPILLPALRILIRIIKGKTSFVDKEIFNKEFFLPYKSLLGYKMRIVRQEFMRFLKEIVKRDNYYAMLLWELSYVEEIIKRIGNEDSMVFLSLDNFNFYCR